MSQLNQLTCASSSLRLYEKCAAMLFISALMILTKFAMQVPEERWPHKKCERRKKQIVVVFSGEIEGEGRYHFPEGTLLKNGLERVILKKMADTKSLKLGVPMKAGQRFKVKKSNKPLRLNEDL